MSACLAAAGLLLGGCADYEVARRAEAAPDSIPSDDQSAFDRIVPLVPVSRASWVGMVEDLDVREWPASMYTDYRRHLDTKRRVGARAGEWPSTRYDRLRLEPFREPLDAQVVTVNGRVLFLVSQAVMRYSAARKDQAGGTFHNLSAVDVATGTEQVIGTHLEGVQFGKPLAFEAVAFDGRLLVLAATMDGVVQVIGQPEPGGMRYGEPGVIASYAVPVTDLAVAASGDRVYAAWMRGKLDTDVRMVSCASSPDPRRAWTQPRPVTDTARAGTLALCATDKAVHVVWGDTRFSRSEQIPHAAWAMVATSRDHADTFGPQTLLGDPDDPDDAAARLVAVPSGDAVLLYWSAQPGAAWPQTWRKSLYEPASGSLALAGEIDGSELLAAYQRRMTAALTEQGAARHAQAE